MDPETDSATTESVLSLRDFTVTFTTLFGEVQAVRGVDLDVLPGELLGIVGESGSGKSVTFLGLMGLLPKSARISGSARIGDVELVGATKRRINRIRGKRIAMIFQDPLSALNPVHKIGDQIVEMIQSHQSISERQAMAKAVDLLGVVGIPQPKERAAQYPHEFSGGMRQRVMIATAIANDPEVLIADEPTTALDVTVQAQILRLLKKEQERHDLSILLITHDLSIVSAFADRIVVMYAGRILEEGPTQEVMRRPAHPYTRALIRCSLLVPESDGRLMSIPGSGSQALAIKEGCRFAPRCSLMREQPGLHSVCCSREPEMEPFAQHWQSRCHASAESLHEGDVA
jgi:oligopeptide/dipeptide ABC transporter ATP-binding protein